MATGNNIQSFTAVDIEKYHKGLLSPAERHALEKASLDDPFLADALEGYVDTGIDVTADLRDLQNRLAERTGQAKLIPIERAATRRSYTWLRAAAIIVLVSTAGLLTYQFAFNKSDRQNNIAQATNKEAQAQQPVGLTDTISKEVAQSESKNFVSPLTPSADDAPGNAESSVELDGQGALKKEVLRDSIVINMNGVADFKAKEEAPGEIVRSAKPVVGYTSTPAKTDNAKAAPVQPPATSDVVLNDKAKSGGELKRNAIDNKTLSAEREQAQTRANQNASARKDNNDFFNQQTNNFRGRVTDNNNNGLPFANVTNVEDNIGTYTDSRGYFNLTSTDSLLNVQVKAVGFNVYNIKLQPTTATQQVVMQEDRSIAAQTLSNQRVNYEKRSRNANMKLEGEPEPEDGWEYYDNYLSNNLNLSEDALRTKKQGGGAVDISFEVNKFGEPVNFKVEKSLCTKCDQEAIRLIKDGPKWKRKAKKGRTTVTISF